MRTRLCDEISANSLNVKKSLPAEIVVSIFCVVLIEQSRV